VIFCFGQRLSKIKKCRRRHQHLFNGRQRQRGKGPYRSLRVSSFQFQSTAHIPLPSPYHSLALISTPPLSTVSCFVQTEKLLGALGILTFPFFLHLYFVLSVRSLVSLARTFKLRKGLGMKCRLGKSEYDISCHLNCNRYFLVRPKTFYTV